MLLKNLATKFLVDELGFTDKELIHRHVENIVDDLNSVKYILHVFEQSDLYDGLTDREKIASLLDYLRFRYTYDDPSRGLCFWIVVPHDDDDDDDSDDWINYLTNKDNIDKYYTDLLVLSSLKEGLATSVLSLASKIIRKIANFFASLSLLLSKSKYYSYKLSLQYNAVRQCYSDCGVSPSMFLAKDVTSLLTSISGLKDEEFNCVSRCVINFMINKASLLLSALYDCLYASDNEKTADELYKALKNLTLAEKGLRGIRIKGCSVYAKKLIELENLIVDYVDTIYKGSDMREKILKEYIEKLRKVKLPRGKQHAEMKLEEHNI